MNSARLGFCQTMPNGQTQSSQKTQGIDGFLALGPKGHPAAYRSSRNCKQQQHFEKKKHGRIMKNPIFQPGFYVFFFLGGGISSHNEKGFICWYLKASQKRGIFKHELGDRSGPPLGGGKGPRVATCDQMRGPDFCRSRHLNVAHRLDAIALGPTTSKPYWRVMNQESYEFQFRIRRTVYNITKHVENLFICFCGLFIAQIPGESW